MENAIWRVLNGNVTVWRIFPECSIKNSQLFVYTSLRHLFKTNFIQVTFLNSNFDWTTPAWIGPGVSSCAAPLRALVHRTTFQLESMALLNFWSTFSIWKGRISGNMQRFDTVTVHPRRDFHSGPSRLALNHGKRYLQKSDLLSSPWLLIRFYL